MRIFAHKKLQSNYRTFTNFDEILKMRTIRRILLIISMVLFAWMFINALDDIDFAASKNHAFILSETSKTEKFKDIEKLKEFTKSKIYIVERIHQQRSLEADRKLYIIFSLVVIQLFLYVTTNFRKNL